MSFSHKTNELLVQFILVFHKFERFSFSFEVFHSVLLVAFVNFLRFSEDFHMNFQLLIEFSMLSNKLPLFFINFFQFFMKFSMIFRLFFIKINFLSLKFLHSLPHYFFTNFIKLFWSHFNVLIFRSLLTFGVF